MIKTKEMNNKEFKLKSNKGITLVSLVITIVVLFIVSSISIYTSMDRFEINNLKKMQNDIELLNDAVNNYYLKYNKLPILEEYNYTTLDFDKNASDGSAYYIIDLEVMENISLNYGKEGFEKPNSNVDVYIINEKSHTIYYVKGIELDGVTYHTIKNNTNTIDDNIPPSKPEIKVISGSTDDDGIYITDVKIEIIPGNDWAGIKQTTLFVNDIEKDIENSTYNITTNGTYKIKVVSEDINDKKSEYIKEIVVKKANIVLDKTELALEIDEDSKATAELNAVLDNVSKDFKWKVSEDSGLIISGEGNTKTITATKAVENATITVSYGLLSTTCNVTVKEKELVQQDDELAGTWVFNDKITLLEGETTYNLDFETDGENYSTITFSYEDEGFGMIEQYMYYMNPIKGFEALVYNKVQRDSIISEKWEFDYWKTIVISTKLSEMENGEEFLLWLKANATKIQ